MRNANPPYLSNPRRRSRVAALLATASAAVSGSPTLYAAEPAPVLDELNVLSAKQTAIDAEAISISDTPDAVPSVGKTTILVGLAARVAPVYDGSKSDKVSPYPYIDIHGLWHDRIFLSDLRGIGFNVVHTDALHFGFSVNYGGGRTSSDATRLRGLPDISDSVGVASFITYTIKPVSFEAKVERQFGSQPATEVSLRASYLATITPRWHISLGAQVNWDDAKFNQKFFGITPAESAAAAAQGNSLASYRPGSGIGSTGITMTNVYALSEHWGLVARVGFRELVGSAAKDSPLTDKTNGADVALGALYKFR